jgi:hypothetical protein
MMGRYLTLIRATGRTHGIRCCDFSVVGYLFVTKRLKENEFSEKKIVLFIFILSIGQIFE